MIGWNKCDRKNKNVHIVVWVLIRGASDPCLGLKMSDQDPSASYSFMSSVQSFKTFNITLDSSRRVAVMPHFVVLSDSKCDSRVMMLEIHWEENENSKWSYALALPLTFSVTWIRQLTSVFIRCQSCKYTLSHLLDINSRSQEFSRGHDRVRILVVQSEILPKYVLKQDCTVIIFYSPGKQQ